MALGARFGAAMDAAYPPPLAELARLAGVGLRAAATSPFTTLVADDRGAPLAPDDVALLARAAGALLGVPRVRLAALTALPPERRAAVWSAATPLRSAPAGGGDP